MELSRSETSLVCPAMAGIRRLLAALVMSAMPIASMAKPPDGVEVVDGFELERYLGLWYEVVRTDNRFERNLNNVTAEYREIDDETIRVINRGYNTKSEDWDESTAKARLNGEPGQGQLRVTFFWPFSSGYYIFDLDREHYQYALVSGDNHSYFWILARTPRIDEALMDELLLKAKKAGFDTGDLVFVEHDDPSGYTRVD